MTQSAPQTGISLSVSRTINAPRERVFAAWTQPELLHQWWGAHESFSAPIAEVDLRVGGSSASGCWSRVKTPLTCPMASTKR